MKKVILVIFMCLMICSCKNNNVFKKDANMLIINNLSDKDVKEKLLLERDNEEEIDKITNYFYKSKKISQRKFEKANFKDKYVIDISYDKDSLTLYVSIDKDDKTAYINYVYDEKEYTRKLNKKNSKNLIKLLKD